MTKINNPWIPCNDAYCHNNVYYWFWKRKEPDDCIWIYQVTTSYNLSPTETSGGYISKDALIKAKFGK